jgi:hypothetical protein
VGSRQDDLDSSRLVTAVKYLAVIGLAGFAIYKTFRYVSAASPPQPQAKLS